MILSPQELQNKLCGCLLFFRSRAVEDAEIETSCEPQTGWW